MLSSLALFVILGLVLIATSRALGRGRRGLVLSAALVAGILCVLSLVMASPRFGNRLSESEGYWLLAGRIFGLQVLTVGMPLGLVAAATLAARRVTSNRIVIALAGVVAAIGGLALATIGALALYWWW